MEKEDLQQETVSIKREKKKKKKTHGSRDAGESVCVREKALPARTQRRGRVLEREKVMRGIKSNTAPVGSGGGQGRR